MHLTPLFQEGAININDWSYTKIWQESWAIIKIYTG